MTTNVIKLLLMVLGGILIGLICYGAYQYYFLKPTPVINNIIKPESGNVTLQQGQTDKSKSLFTEIFTQIDTDKEWTSGMRMGLRF